MKQHDTYRRQLRLLLLPYLIGAVVLVIVPAALTFILAFTNYDVLSPPRWVGWQSMRLAVANPLFWIALRNSLYFILLAVPLRVLGALMLALLLERRRRGVGVYRAGVYLPTVVPAVAYALVWLWIFNPLYGPLNLVLRAVGLPAPAWLIDPNLAKLAFVIMAFFQIGEGFVLLLAALHTIPRPLYDAAAVDGGNWWQVFYHITLPFVIPWLALLTVRDIIMSFQHTFTPAYIMTGGDPYYSTFFLPLLIYEEAFDRFRFGEGASLMLIMFLVTLLLVLAVYLLFQGRGYAEDMA